MSLDSTNIDVVCLFYLTEINNNNNNNIYALCMESIWTTRGALLHTIYGKLCGGGDKFLRLCLVGEVEK